MKRIVIAIQICILFIMEIIGIIFIFTSISLNSNLVIQSNSVIHMQLIAIWAGITGAILLSSSIFISLFYLLRSK